MIYNNCNACTLLSGRDIIISDENFDYHFHIPTIGELYTSEYDSSFFMGFMSSSEEKLSKMLKVENFDRIGFIKELLEIQPSERYYKSLLYFLQICCKNKLEFVDDWLLLDGHRITQQIFDVFLLCFKLGMGTMSQKEFNGQVEFASVKKTKEELEWDRKQRAYQERISKAKSKEGNNIDIKDLLLVISFEFKMSFEDLLNKNFFTIYSLYNSSLKADVHRVSIVANGNGLSKKGYKHWIDSK